MTTKVITPFEEKPIGTIDEFGMNKYKLLVREETEGNLLAKHIHLPKKYWNTTIKINPEINLLEGVYDDPFKMFGKFQRTSCFIVKESMPVGMSLWTLRLPLARKTRGYLEQLRSCGITGWWGEWVVRRKIKQYILNKIKKNGITRSEFLPGVTQPMPLVLESKPTIIFLFYICLIVCGMFCFLVEKCMHYG
ncbi:hypothetical protein Fcan01_16871 [Folsomia candida]|uniref:Uncharacterized protein n=1 Tax=Folsomia candida TaxID=158441 RepID=A0A226DSB8_FOLCA|nr:hypothetical protein Fcan01_16871 [Folsomia candida]